MKASDVIKWMQAYQPDEELLIAWLDRDQFTVRNNDKDIDERATKETWSEINETLFDIEFISEHYSDEAYNLVLQASKTKGKTEPVERVAAQ